MANKRSPVVPLTEDLQEKLVKLSHQRSLSAGVLRRIKIVLYGAQGKSNYRISRELGMSEAMVKRWRKRWTEQYESLEQLTTTQVEVVNTKITLRILEVFKDHPRSGAPAKFKPEEQKQIVTMACEDPQEEGYILPHWTHEQLAQAAVEKGIVAYISPSQVGRILKKGGRQTA